MYCKLNDNLQIYYEKAGSGPPLILIHGNSCTHKMFNKIIPYLSEKNTVYAMDLPNYGKSSRIRFDTYEDFADICMDFVKKLYLLEKPKILGYSDGGIIALLMASRYPDLLEEIFPCGANLNPHAMKNYAYWSFKMGAIFSKDFKILVKEPNIDLQELHKIKIPTHLIYGEKDFIKRSHILEISNNISNCSLDILKGNGHLSYIHYSDKVIPTLKKLKL
ncbi:MAG: alpha/beta fold hydrolase [Sarcina sp.]